MKKHLSIILGLILLVVFTNVNAQSKMHLGVGVGYEFGSFDVNVKYTGAGSGISYIGARVGYRFAL